MGVLRDDGAGRPGEPPWAMTVPLPAPSAAAATPGVPAAGSPSGADRARSELRRRRDELAEQVTELHWDLGGLAYEMAIRDHFRLDVLVRRAAVLQERDGELAEVERLLRMEEEAVAGGCPSCGAPHSRGALYCWQCGGALMQRLPSSAVSPGESTEGGLQELLAAASTPTLEMPTPDGG